MHLSIDMHTHSIASGHAYSTLEEMIRGAKDNSVEMFALTDHGPNMSGSADESYFRLLPRLPEKLEGIFILKGIEANILDEYGRLDLDFSYLKNLEIVIASLHDVCISATSKEKNTSAVINAIRNPVVDIIGHIGDPSYQLDYEKIVDEAKKFNKIIEINNSSYKSRKGSYENCIKVADLCKNKGVRVSSGSDAHIRYDIGRFDNVYRILSAVDMPKSLILNYTVNDVFSYLSERKIRLAN